MDEKRADILRRMGEALHRMKEDGAEDDDCPYYANLTAKRNAIANGEPYATYNVSTFLIRAMGAQIPSVNMGYKGKTIKSRGKWESVVIPTEYIE